MALGPASYGLGFLAGVVSLLSPCVLPLLPIVFGTALAAHRWGAVVLALGLASSFTAMGLVVATVGFALGIGSDWFRNAGAVALVAFGVILLSGSLQHRFVRATASVGAVADRWLRRTRIEGLGGQFVVGVVLGLVWAPCVGPTLGAAATLASEGKHLGQVALLMAIFGLGAGLPLAMVGSIAHRSLANTRTKLLRVGVYGKYILGALFIVLGIGVLTGGDRLLEAYLVDVSPPWLTGFTTEY